MKKHLLLGLSVFAFGVINAQTINKEELKWTIGNQWIMNVDAVSTGSLDLAAGTGKTWDFTGYLGASGKDTIKVQSSTVGDVKIYSNILTQIDYKSLTSDYSGAAVIGIPLTSPSTLTMGLPHTYNKTWNSSGSALGGLYNLFLAGTVPCSGTIKVPWGTFNCLLVKEVTTGNLPGTVYHWETVEHGRVASFNGSKLLVMQSTNFTVGVNKVNSNTSFNVFPNPTNSLLNITSENGGAVKIFNALGNVVKQFNHNGGNVRLDVSNLSNGMYFVQLTSDKGVVTKSIIVK